MLEELEFFKKQLRMEERDPEVFRTANEKM